jgi:hypothetical protein
MPTYFTQIADEPIFLERTDVIESLILKNLQKSRDDASCTPRKGVGLSATLVGATLFLLVS